MLKKLKKCLEYERKDKSIFDIIIYGSFVKGKSKPNDVDVLVIFLGDKLADRLDKLQRIKQRATNLNLNFDFKQILITELFSSDFFARSGVLLEGVSVFRKNKISELLGFKSYTFFWYTLEGLSHSKKVMFNYVLAGRGSMKGMIKELSAKRLVNGAVRIPIEHSLEFEELLKKHTVKFNKKNILEEI